MANQSNVEKTGTALTTHYASTISGKTILITGVSPNSLAAHFALTIAAASPALLILAGRNPQKLAETAGTIAAKYPTVKTKTLQLDLSSLNAVRDSAKEFLSWDDVPALDVLVNSAGIMAVPYALSADGHEMQFATNHLGHFLFTNLIMSRILASSSPRIVSVTSSGHQYSYIRFPDISFDEGKEYEKWTAYGQSKTANIHFATSLAEKLGQRGVVAVSMHPGAIATNLGGHLDFTPGGDVDQLLKISRTKGLKAGWSTGFDLISIDHGAATYVFASFEPTLKENNGAYLLEARVADPFVDQVAPWVANKVEAEKLWRLSEELVGQKFAY